MEPGPGVLARMQRGARGLRAGTLLGAIALLAGVGCTPTVAVQAPKEPIVINMNVEIEHEVRIKVDKELEELRETRDDIF